MGIAVLVLKNNSTKLLKLWMFHNPKNGPKIARKCNKNDSYIAKKWKNPKNFFSGKRIKANPEINWQWPRKRHQNICISAQNWNWTLGGHGQRTSHGIPFANHRDIPIMLINELFKDFEKFSSKLSWFLDMNRYFT